MSEQDVSNNQININLLGSIDADDHAVVVKLQADHPLIKKVIATPMGVSALANSICKAFSLSNKLGTEKRLVGLPLVNNHPLSGRWSMASPCGQESTSPHHAWNFEARMKASLENPDAYPLLQGFVTGNEDGADDKMASLEESVDLSNFETEAFSQETINKIANDIRDDTDEEEISLTDFIENTENKIRQLLGDAVLEIEHVYVPGPFDNLFGD